MRLKFALHKRLIIFGVKPYYPKKGTLRNINYLLMESSRIYLSMSGFKFKY